MNGRPLRYGRTERFRIDASTSIKIDECVAAETASDPSRRSSKSSVLRNAVSLYHDHLVRGHTIAADSDPRYMPPGREDGAGEPWRPPAE